MTKAKSRGGFTVRKALIVGGVAVLALLALILALNGPGPRPAALVSDYAIFGCCSYAAVVDPQKLESGMELPAIGKYVCHRVQTNGCFVKVYFVGRKLPAEGSEVEDIVRLGKPDFVYNRNYKTNFEQSLWNCDTYSSEAYGDQCIG